MQQNVPIPPRKPRPLNEPFKPVNVFEAREIRRQRQEEIAQAIRAAVAEHVDDSWLVNNGNVPLSDEFIKSTNNRPAISLQTLDEPFSGIEMTTDIPKIDPRIFEDARKAVDDLFTEDEPGNGATGTNG
ncbi:hypothetical protein JW758_02685 [Candidatus Peregrinibacteria bacterium]|nr:hypothetical protein [Candidatus Peregrinibacteria bacterium]